MYSSWMEYLNDFWGMDGPTRCVFYINLTEVIYQLGGCVEQHTECMTSWMIEGSWTCIYTKCFHLPIGLKLT